MFTVVGNLAYLAPLSFLSRSNNHRGRLRARSPSLCGLQALRCRPVYAHLWDTRGDCREKGQEFSERGEIGAAMRTHKLSAIVASCLIILPAVPAGASVWSVIKNEQDPFDKAKSTFIATTGTIGDGLAIRCLEGGISLLLLSGPSNASAGEPTELRSSPTTCRSARRKTPQCCGHELLNVRSIW